MHVAGCYDRTREKFSRPLRDAVRGAIFFRTPFSYEKMCSVALLSSGLTRRLRTRCFTFDFWRLKSSVVLLGQQPHLNSLIGRIELKNTCCVYNIFEDR